MVVISRHDIASLNAGLRGRYRVERLLGEGGMATVYLAEDLRHRRQVAVKVLRPELATAVGEERFLREIDIAAHLVHAHIVPVYDSGAADGMLLYVMPYIEGETLRSRIVREGRLGVAAAVRILREVLEALSKAHARGVVHRDIKPENVMLADGHAHVMDFGMAKVAIDASVRSALTSTGLAVGTPSYMSPEQAAGEPHIDHRADIYAVGVVAYELLTGHAPFEADTAHQTAMAHLAQTPVALGDVRPDLSPDLTDAVMKCLEKSPDARWQTADAFATHLGALAISDATAGGARRPRRAPARRGWSFRRGAVAVAAVMVVAAGIWRWSSASSPATPVDPGVVAVLPFRVAGADPALAYLREGMVDLLWMRLNGEGGLRASDPNVVLGREDVLAAFDTAEPRIDQLVRFGREVGAGRVLSGAIVGTPERIVLSAAVTPVGSDEPSARASVVGPSDSLISMVDGLVVQLLARGAGLPEQSASALVRHPLSAVRAYLAGRAARRRGRYDDAVAHFREALAHDSTFAQAGLEVIFISGWTVVPDLWEIRRRVWELREQLSARDRLLVEVRGLFPTAARPLRHRLRMAEQAAAVMPSDPELWEILGDLYFHSGALLAVEDAWQRAEIAFQRALAADSNRAGPLQHLIHMRALAADTTGLASLADRYVQQDSTSELSLFLQWLVAVVGDDGAGRDRIRAVFDAAPRLGVEVAEVAEVDLVGLDDADSALAASRRRASTAGERSFAHLKSAFRELNRGRPDEAERYLDAVGSQATRMMAALFWDGDSAAAVRAAAEAESLANEPQPADETARFYRDRAVCLVPVWRLAQGDGANVDQMLARLARSAPTGDTTTYATANRVCITLVEALAASLRGAPDAVERVAVLDTLSRAGPAWWSVIPLNLIIGQLYRRFEQPGAALEAVRRRPYWSGMFSGVGYLSSYLLLEARLSAQVGDTTGAIDAYEHYLRLRSDPAPGLVREWNAVRGELARLLGDGKP